MITWQKSLWELQILSCTYFFTSYPTNLKHFNLLFAVNWNWCSVWNFFSYCVTKEYQMLQSQTSMDIIVIISSPQMLVMNAEWSRPSLLVHSLLLCLL